MPITLTNVSAPFEAHQWTGDNVEETRHWLGYAFAFVTDDNALVLQERNGRVQVRPGEWIIQQGVFFVWEPHTFTRRVGRIT